MNRISIYKNLTKKISVFFLVFFVFISFFNSSKAQNVNPSEIKLYSYTYGGGGMYSTSQTVTSSFKELVSYYLNTTQHTSGNNDIRPGAYNQNIKNLTAEINSLIPKFDSSFTTILTNSGNLGVSKDNTDIIIGTFLFKKIIGDEINKITQLKNNSSNSDEKNIANDIIKEMSGDLSSYTNNIGNSGTMSAYSYKYQLSSDGTKIVNTANINATSSGGWGSGNNNSYQDIINQIIYAIDEKADDSSSQKNEDIISLKNTATSSINTFNEALKKIQSSLNNSSGVAITPDQQIFLAKIETLTPIDNIINSYLADTNNQKPGNDKIINAYTNAKSVVENYLKDASSTINDAKINYNSTAGTITKNNNADCDSKGFWSTVFSSNSGCSISAYLINGVIQLINGLVNIVVNLAGSLFDWIYQIGVIGFKGWVDGSGAYTIYKTVILSLLISVMMFFVLYLIIRRLIDDDGEKMNKVLPGLILTALFVYFSFTITGWIIDQSNIMTIYLYRSMTHQTGTVQTIGEVFKRILSLDNGGANVGGNGISGNFGVSLGSWNAIPFTLGQLVVSIVGVFVLFEGAILILSRTIILLLCMIFSPLMLIPEGLTDFTDKYKKLIMDNFTGNVILGPIFMFLVLLAVQIGQITTKMVGGGPSFDNSGVKDVPTNFLGGIISSVLVIVVLQLAISVSKSFSGSAGEKLSGVISKYAGGAAFGGGAKILRNTIGRGAAVARDRGWMMGKEGSTRHKFMSNLYNGAAKSTFDARNSSNFQKAADFSGAGAAFFGKGSEKNYNDTFKRKLYDANKYHSGLDEGGKQRNIVRLRNSSEIDNRRIAESLEKKWKPSINERINNDSEYNKKFDKATTEKDETKRKTEVDKVINEHFKENGLGEGHFTKEINKPENNKIKTEYEKVLNTEKDPVKRKEVLTKIIADLDKKTSPEEGSVQSLTESLGKTNLQSVNKPSGPKPSTANTENINSLRSRLQAKYSKEDVNEFRNKRMTMYQEKSLKETKEKQDSEIEKEKESNGGYIPSAKDLDAQSSLKQRLQQKYGATERMENGKIVQGFSQEQLDRKIQENKNIKENQYQDKVLKEALSKNDDEPTDDKPFNPPTGGAVGNKSSVSVDSSGKLIQMHTPDQLAILNKNRNNGGGKAA